MDSQGLMVLKVGGGEVGRPEFLESLAKLVARMQRKPVIVHGGGRDIGKYLDQLGIESKFHEGLRITDDVTIEVVEMVLSGLVNKRIVGALVVARVKALGISGRDLRLVRASKLEAEVDLGHVGESQWVNARIVGELLEQGFVPVISPVSQDAKGTVFNINADHMARAVAVGLRVTELVFLSDVPCVYDDVHKIAKLNRKLAEQLIETEVIGGGMVPKVRSGIQALEKGVKRVLITDLEGLGNYLNGNITATVITL